MGGESLPMVGKILGHTQARPLLDTPILPTTPCRAHRTGWPCPSRRPWTRLGRGRLLLSTDARGAFRRSPQSHLSGSRDYLRGHWLIS